MPKSPLNFLTYKEKSHAILFKSKKFRSGPLRGPLEGLFRFPSPGPPKVQTLATPLGCGNYSKLNGCFAFISVGLYSSLASIQLGIHTFLTLFLQNLIIAIFHI